MAPKLRVQNIPTAKLHGTLEYKSGVVDYKLEGTTLGGTFELEGQIPSAAPVKQEPKPGKLRLENLSLRRLMDAWDIRETVPLVGRLRIELDFTHATLDHMPKGKGRVRVDNLRWNGATIATGLDGELLLADGVLRLRELSADVGQGTARVQLTYDVHHPQRSRFSLTLEDVEAAQVLAPWLGDKVKGVLQGRIHGALGTSWRGTADLELTRGEVFGMEVSQWRLPADWHYSPATQRAHVDIYDTTAQVARGRVMGKMSATWDYTLRVEGELRFFGVDLQTLIRPFYGPTTLAAGQVTGRLEFAGAEVRTVNDLTGSVVATFQQAQALQMPVLRQLTPFIGMGPTTTFQRGVLRAASTAAWCASSNSRSKAATCNFTSTAPPRSQAGSTSTRSPEAATSACRRCGSA